MVHPLTIVLPLYNAERLVEKSVQKILDETQSTGHAISLVLVDDGSTDETYEVACQLSRCFPQVSALRQPVRSGLGAAVELVRKRIVAQRILIHDGVTPICASQLSQMLRAQHDRADEGLSDMQEKTRIETQGSRRFSAVSALHDSLRRAHRPILGFRWLQLTESVPAGRRNRAKVSPSDNQIPSPAMSLAPAPNLPVVPSNTAI